MHRRLLHQVPEGREGSLAAASFSPVIPKQEGDASPAYIEGNGIQQPVAVSRQADIPCRQDHLAGLAVRRHGQGSEGCCAVSGWRCSPRGRQAAARSRVPWQTQVRPSTWQVRSTLSSRVLNAGCYRQQSSPLRPLKWPDAGRLLESNCIQQNLSPKRLCKT